MAACDKLKRRTWLQQELASLLVTRTTRSRVSASRRSRRLTICAPALGQARPQPCVHGAALLQSQQETRWASCLQTFLCPLDTELPVEAFCLERKRSVILKK